MLYEANMGNSKAKVMRGFKATGLRYRINSVSGGRGGLHFKWCQEEAEGVRNQYNCVGAPTTFGRHCLNIIFKEDR